MSSRRATSEAILPEVSCSSRDYSKLSLPVETARSKGDKSEGALVSVATKSGIQVEVVAASVEVSHKQAEISLAAARVSKNNEGQGQVTVEAMALHAGVGRHNADGSEGVHAVALGTVVGAEGTSHWDVAGRHVSLTGGVALGDGAEVSVGVRKGEQGHADEACFRLSAWVVTYGACVESAAGAKVVDTAIQMGTTFSPSSD